MCVKEENTILGKYRYSVPKFDGTFTHRESKVKIIDETDKSYKVEFLEFTDKRKPGDTAWVSKRKVKTTARIKKENERHWWQDVFQ